MPKRSADPLRIGGLQAFTSIDYPGQLAAVVFCQGCPWRCSYCHNPELLPGRGKAEIPWPEVIGFLQQRRGLLDAVVFSGGEPTLQKGLIDAVRQVKAMGFKVGLHSAGCYPQRLAEVLPLLDWIGLDIKALAEAYPKLTGDPNSGDRAWASLRQVVDCPALDYEVRVTVDEALAASGHLAVLIERLQSSGVRHLVLQGCRQADGGPAVTGWEHIQADFVDQFSSLRIRVS